MIYRLTILVISVVLFAASGLWAQVQVHNFGMNHKEKQIKVLDYRESDFSTLAVKAQVDDAIEYTMAYKIDDQQYRLLHTDPHVNNLDGYWISELLFLPKGTKTLTLKVLSDQQPIQMYIRQFAPTKGEILNYKPLDSDNSTQLRGECSCERPTMLDRESWCDGGCPKNYEPYTMDVTHLIIHHSAGPNESNDWAAVVESYWDFHVNTRGWDDIGYNWLIDPDGKIYIGRGEDVRGAHFCAKNTGSMGICMIGTFTDVEPSSSALNTLEKLLAWKACKNDINPTESSFYASSGKDLNNITGHRSDCATTCPGDQLWNLLPEIRNNVQNYIQSNCSNTEEIVLSGSYIEEENLIVLNWTPSFTAIDSFIVYKKSRFSTFEAYDSTDSQRLKYIDRDIVPGEKYSYTVTSTNLNGLISSNQISIPIPDFYKPILVPNFAQNKIYLKMRLGEKKPYRYFIYNIQGKLMDRGIFVSGSVTFQKEIDISRYSSGQYYLKLESGEDIETLKFQKVD